MDTPAPQCPHCGADTSRDHAAGLTYCSACGRDLAPVLYAPKEPQVPLDADDLADLRRWRICFWLCFLLTPAATMLAGFGIPTLIRMMPGVGGRAVQLLGGYAVFGVFVVGTLSSAYCLLRIKNEKLDRAEVIARVILYAVGMVFAYIGILFAGCLTVTPFLR